MRALFALWIAVVAAGGACLMTRHHRTLRPAGPEASADATGAARLVHVLVPGCACSQRIARELIGQPGEIRWVDQAGAQELHERYGVPGGPWLLALDGAGRIVYSGGYGRNVDGRMLARLAQGGREPARRSYGCAFSQRNVDREEEASR